eukprot:8009774-Pyramimonas_sp.AAC.1
MTEDGGLTVRANPWALRVLVALGALLEVEDAGCFLSELRTSHDANPETDAHAYLSDSVCETEARRDCQKVDAGP